MQTEKEYTAGREVSALRCESVGEYSLPDYNGDVKKILVVKTSVYPSGKFVGDEMLEFSGTVGYNVVYVDGENTVTHAEFGTDYDAALKINSESYVDSDVHTKVSSYNVRLVGPRKFSVKAILESDICISENKSYSIGGDAFMEYEPEYTSESAGVLSMAFATADARDFDEEICAVDGAIADEVEILLCDIHPDVEIGERTDTAAILKGSVGVSMLYRNGSESPRRIDKSIPYYEEVYLDGSSELTSATARLEVLSKKCAVTPTEDGVKLSASFGIAPRIVGRKNCFVNLVSDSYLKERGSVNEYSDFGYIEQVCSACTEGKVEAEKPTFELDLDGANDILYADASVRCDSPELVNGSVKIKGEVRFSGIASQELDNGDVSYAPVKISTLFEQNVNLDCQIHDNMRVDHHTSVKDVRMEIDNGRVISRATLLTCVNVSANKRTRCLGASYVTDEEYLRDESVLTVYYPDPGESLFEIAKKYHTSVRTIAESNRLTEAVFSTPSAPLGVSKLIIK